MNYIDTVKQLGYPADTIKGYAVNEIPDHIPHALATYYHQVGKMAFNMAHNELYPPKALTQQDQRWVFMHENQSVAYWAFDCNSTEPDPLVLQYLSCENGYEWHPETQLQEFLTRMMYFQTSMGGFPYCGTSDNHSLLLQLQQQWNVTPYNFDGMSFIVQKGIVVLAFDAKELDIFVSAYYESKLEEFENTFQLQLEHL
ncbi:MAG: hypothetical protein OEZ68_02660 [Gammaproteobacteria bacterium]|nr:hypothetical protein [Gammaproteobacteria bacterium]MDH5799682.1 hypothetical protein [Gammaproteobacteria bacterium]